MLSSSLRRACTTALGMLVSATALTAAAPPAAATCSSEGATAGVVGAPASATVYPGGTVCYDLGSGPTVVWLDAGTMLAATPTFECGTWQAGSVGDPAEPETYVPFRIGAQAPADSAQPALLCFEARGVQVTASYVPDGTPPRIVTAPSHAWDSGCGGYSRDGMPYEAVLVDVAGEQQSVYVGVGTLAGGGADNDCAGTAGPLAACGVTSYAPATWSVTDPASCPTGATLLGMPEDVVAWATDTAAELVTIVDGVVRDVRETVGAYVAQVLGIVDPILTEAYETVGETLGALPVEVAADADGCTFSVATFGGYAVSRSGTGEVPVSVCVATSSGVTRVTIG